MKYSIGRILKSLLNACFVALFAGLVLFLSSGRPDWLMAYVFIGANLINSFLMALIPDPELIAERARTKNKEGIKKWDLIFVNLLGWVCPTALLITAGLDKRFGWSVPMPVLFQVFALFIGLAGLLLADWAMLSNKFFSSFVRIQKERGHTVVTTGPYQVLRHPGYAGGLIFNMATPLILGTMWAFIPAVFLSAVTIFRTMLEDKTLHEELPGYREYAQKVPYRLFPYLW